MIQPATLMLVLCSVLFSVAGQLLLKSGTQRVTSATQSGFLIAAFRDMHVVLGLTAWVASTVCWLFVLRVAPLSRAYGLTSLTYVLIFLSSVFLLDEQVRRVHVLGTLLIVSGIACLLAGD
jgi:undecaprenyl phosphate-alpha-L-ara4N flippase subunit ArnF